MTKWRVKESAMEPTSHKFDQGGMVTRDWFSDKLFMAFNISIVTSTERAIVIGWGSVNTLQSTPCEYFIFVIKHHLNIFFTAY